MGQLCVSILLATTACARCCAPERLFFTHSLCLQGHALTCAHQCCCEPIVTTLLACCCSGVQRILAVKYAIPPALKISPECQVGRDEACWAEDLELGLVGQGCAWYRSHMWVEQVARQGATCTPIKQDWPGCRVDRRTLLLSHVQDLLSRIFVANPAERITLAQIKQHPWFLKNLPIELAVSASRDAAEVNCCWAPACRGPTQPASRT